MKNLNRTLKIVRVTNGYIFYPDADISKNMESIPAVFPELNQEALDWLNGYFDQELPNFPDSPSIDDFRPVRNGKGIT